MKKRKKNLAKKKIVVAVSGGFDPVHIGHIRLFQEAKKLGDELVVILNNDNWLMAKKGYVFMPQNERKEILEAIGCVDRVVLTKHPPNPKDMSVCRELEEIRPDIFANGGDRHYHNIPEVFTCNKIGCKMVFNVGRGGKVQSSSWIVEKHRRIARLLEKGRKFSFKKVIVFDLVDIVNQNKHCFFNPEMFELLFALLDQKRIVIINPHCSQFKAQFLKFLKHKEQNLENLLVFCLDSLRFCQYKNGKWRDILVFQPRLKEKERFFCFFGKNLKDVKSKNEINKVLGLFYLFKFWNLSKKDILYLVCSSNEKSKDIISQKAGFNTLRLKDKEEIKTFIHFLINNHNKNFDIV